MESHVDNVSLDWPDEGDFVICVAVYIGNPRSGSICSQGGPVCATVKVRPQPDRVGQPRIICSRQVPYLWFCNIIWLNGEYRCSFVDSKNCCEFDSVLEFIITDLDPSTSIFGTNEFCTNQLWSAWYSAGPILGNNVRHHWIVPNGIFLSNADSSSVHILWSSSGPSQRYLEFSYSSECGISDVADHLIYFNQTFAGYDDKIVGLVYSLKANAYSSGTWSKIMGPGNVQFENEKFPLSKVTVTKHGKYLFRWTNLCSGGLVFDEVWIDFQRFKTTPGETDKNIFKKIQGPILVEERTASEKWKDLVFVVNPTDGSNLFIHFPDLTVETSLRIFNTQGQAIQFHKIPAFTRNFSVDIIPNLNNGIYYVCIQTESGTITKKIIVVN